MPKPRWAFSGARRKGILNTQGQFLGHLTEFSIIFRISFLSLVYAELTVPD